MPTAKPKSSRRGHPLALGWTKDDYGNINMIFSGAYALGLLLAGGYIRKVGIKWGLFFAVLAWTIVSRAHGLVALINPASTTDVFGKIMPTTVVAFCVCHESSSASY